MEAVILAGGLGIRLRPEVTDLPKVLAPVRGRPFLSYVLDFLGQNGVTRFILATGYLHEKIAETIGDKWLDYPVVYSREHEPLGTGGAVRLALRQIEDETALVLNGDTLFTAPLQALMEHHRKTSSDITLALKRVKNVDRYGTVEMAPDGRITEFVEKPPTGAGLINGGIYVVRRDLLNDLQLPDRFSLEEDFLKAFLRTVSIYGFESDAYFIDIGVPDDYRRAQTELAR